MVTLTISKKITKGEELVIIPRKEYEEFSVWQKTLKYFLPSKRQVKDLKKAREEYKKGKYITINELKQKVGIKD